MSLFPLVVKYEIQNFTEMAANHASSELVLHVLQYVLRVAADHHVLQYVLRVAADQCSIVLHQVNFYHHLMASFSREKRMLASYNKDAKKEGKLEHLRIYYDVEWKEVCSYKVLRYPSRE